MTAYFDKHHTDLADLEKRVIAGDYEAYNQTEQLLDKLHFDICLCISLPGFPSDLRDACHLLFAKYFFEPIAGINKNYEDDTGIFKDANHLVWDLHSVFHDLGNRHIDGFDDKPSSPLRRRVSTEEEYRIELLRKTKGFEDLIKQYDDHFRKCEEELNKP